MMSSVPKSRVLFVYLNHDRVPARGPGYLVAAMRNAGHEVRFVDTAYCSLDETAAMATVENVFNQSVLRGVGDKNKNKKASS